MLYLSSELEGSGEKLVFLVGGVWTAQRLVANLLAGVPCLPHVQLTKIASKSAV